MFDLAAIDHALGTLRGENTYFAEGDQGKHPNFKPPGFKPPGFNKRCWRVLRARTAALLPLADPDNWANGDDGLPVFLGDYAAVSAAAAALEES